MDDLDARPEYRRVRVTVLSSEVEYETGKTPVAIQVAALHWGTTASTVLTHEDPVEYLDALSRVVDIALEWIALSYEVEVVAGCHTYESLRDRLRVAGLTDRVPLLPRSDLSSFSDEELRHEMKIRADRAARVWNEGTGDGLTIGHGETSRDWSPTPV